MRMGTQHAHFVLMKYWNSGQWKMAAKTSISATRTSFPFTFPWTWKEGTLHLVASDNTVIKSGIAQVQKPCNQSFLRWQNDKYRLYRCEHNARWSIMLAKSAFPKHMLLKSRVFSPCLLPHIFPLGGETESEAALFYFTMVLAKSIIIILKDSY